MHDRVFVCEELRTRDGRVWHPVASVARGSAGRFYILVEGRLLPVELEGRDEARMLAESWLERRALARAGSAGADICRNVVYPRP